MDLLSSLIILAVVVWMLVSPIIILHLLRKNRLSTRIITEAPAPAQSSIDTVTPPPVIEKAVLNDFELLTKIRSLSPRSFEYYTAEVFKRLGYKTHVTAQHHDNGIDIILHQGSTVSYVQCKKYIDKSVSVGEIRDFYGATVDKLAGGTAFFVTTNVFTAEATQFARASKNSDQIKLIDGHRLIKCIRLIEQKGKPIPFMDFNALKAIQCPVCKSGRLTKRLNKNNGNSFYGCSNYPTCKYARSI